MPKSKKTKTKYYAVAQGKTPGIYRTWDDAMEQMRGLKNSRHRSFKTIQDAEQYLLENGVGVSAVATRASRRLVGLPAHGFTPKKKAKGPSERPALQPQLELSDASFSPSPSTSATPEPSARSVDESQNRSSRASTPHSGAPDIADALESLLRLRELTSDALRAFGRDDEMQPLSAGMMAKAEAMSVLRRVSEGLQREHRILDAVCAEPIPRPTPPAFQPREKDRNLDPPTQIDEHSADVSFLSLYYES